MHTASEAHLQLNKCAVNCPASQSEKGRHNPKENYHESPDPASKILSVLLSWTWWTICQKTRLWEYSNQIFSNIPFSGMFKLYTLGHAAKLQQWCAWNSMGLGNLENLLAIIIRK